MRVRWFACLVALSCFAFGAAAQTSPPTRTAALDTIEAKFNALYVFPDMRPKIIARLEEGRRSGRYNVDDPHVFADRITRDLRDVAHDEHLALSVDPAGYAAAVAPPESDSGEAAFTRRRALRDHHGVAELRVLPGNVRYVKITHFEWVPDETGAIYDDAMRFLKDGDAWIIDLRGNGGGTAAAPHYLLSHFLEPGTLDYTSLAGSAPPEQSRALDYVPAGRLRGKPLFVLIDGGVGSAAEAVAYDIQQFKLGELVGGTTVGAANNNKLLPIAPNFILSISYGRPVHALSGTNWEGVGVTPTVACPPAQALDVAQLLALTRLAAAPGVTPEVKAEYAWARVAVEARLHPVTFTPTQLHALAGRYGTASVGYGEIDVAFRDGALWLIRPHRPEARLSPLTVDGVFAIEGSDLLRARIARTQLDLLWWDDPAPRVFIRQ
jgi:Peptidase family S41